jgi:hypothetical protein
LRTRAITNGIEAGLQTASAGLFDNLGVPAPLRFDRNFVPDIIDIAVQEFSHFLHGRAECEAVPKFGDINRGPGLFVLSVHRPPHRRPNCNSF